MKETILEHSKGTKKLKFRIQNDHLRKTTTRESSQSSKTPWEIINHKSNDIKEKIIWNSFSVHQQV